MLAARSKAVKDAKRNLIVARGYARQAAVGRDAETRRLVAESNADVLKAWEEIDVAELTLEYTREMRKTLSEAIEILRPSTPIFEESTDDWSGARRNPLTDLLSSRAAVKPGVDLCEHF